MSCYYQLSLDERVNKLWRKNKICKSLKRKSSPTKLIKVIFQGMLKRFRRVRALPEVFSKMKITKILDEILKNDYFGTSRNRRRFYHLVNRITTQSRFECVHSSTLCIGYDIEAMDWLQRENLDQKRSRMMLAAVNRDLLKYIVKPLIKHFYYPLKSLRDYEVRFVERPKWQSFLGKNLIALLKSGHLSPTDDSVATRGILRLFPKTDCDSLDYRPVISPFKRNKTTKLKFRRLSKMISQLAKKTSGEIGNHSLFTQWMNYTCYISEDDMYGVKLDVKDAFGNVDIPLLCQAINNSNFAAADKSFIVGHIQNQFVEFNKKVYRWNHGLLQGDHLSSSLCDLYMSIMEKKHLLVFLGENVFLHRFVDDYMMCSNNAVDVGKFVETVEEIFELNASKTEYAGNEYGSDELTYYGQVFNLKTREVSKYYSFKRDKSIRHKFKFWNIANPVPGKSKKMLILNTLKFAYNNHCFKKLELNTLFNTEGRLLMNFFKGMIFIAFKFDAVVMAIRDYEQKPNELLFLTELINGVIHNYSNIVFYKIQKCVGGNYTGSVTYPMLRNIGYRAFILVLKKNNAFYETVIRSFKQSNKTFYLNLGNIMIYPDAFSKIPVEFENIKMSRKSPI